MKNTYTNKKKPSYYIISFITAVVVIMLYGLYVNWGSLENYWNWIGEYYLYPVFIILFVFFYHSLVGKLKMKLEHTNTEQRFVLDVSKAVHDTLELTPEEVETLRTSESFQDGLYKAYKIYLEGENPDLNFNHLDKMFKQDTTEYQAMQVIIRDTKSKRTALDKKQNS